MSYFKIFVCLLGCIFACSARPMESLTTGYNYNQGQESSLTKILKAVLVHESTGNGVHSGSIAGHGASGHVTVTKQDENLRGEIVNNPVYPINGNHREGIQVHHKSLGDTGHIQPQASPQIQVVKVKNGYQTPVRQQTDGHVSNFVSFSSSAPQYLGFHQAPLTYNSHKSQKQIAFLPTAVPPNFGYNYGRLGKPEIMNFQNAQNVAPTPTSFFDPATIFASRFGNRSPSSFPSEVLQGPVSNGYDSVPLNGNSQPVQNLQGYGYIEKSGNTGYSYPNPGGAEQIEVSQFVTSTVNSAHHPKSYQPSLAQNIGTLDVSHFVDRPSSENFSNNYLQPESYITKNQFTAQNQAQSNAATQQNGYYYHKPTKIFNEGTPEESKASTQNDGYQYNRPAVTNSVFKGQPYLPITSEAQLNGVQKQSTQFAAQDGYKYLQPGFSSRPTSTFKGQSYLPLPPVSGSW